MKPKFLWHGSIKKHKVLKPSQAVDLTGIKESNLKGVYATDIKELAIEFTLVDKKYQKYADYSKNPVQMVILDGDIRRGEYGYLHKLDSKDFKELPEGSHQWVCMKEVKPIEIIKIKVDDYEHLTRKASKKDKEYFKSMISKFS